ncbi:MAG: hypothetical protein LBH58_14190 [Tannerellaceae bacterium]|jgi:hypothetical protein|nr:hypothetical protein [Tannerellaceae bacterium]
MKKQITLFLVALFICNVGMSNAPGITVSLLSGVYVVKANTAETFKIVIK